MMKNLWLIIPLGMILFFVGRYIYHIPEFEVGTKAPNFQTVLESGEDFDLYEFAEDKLVLIEFWGSWCGPCRQSNRALVDVYEKYGQKPAEDGKSFEIISIALEQTNDKEIWAKAVAKDGLIWEKHVRQNWKNSVLKDLYKITEVPSNYLVRKDGRILGVNMTEKELDKYLKDNLVK